jgi:mannose-6-phosphate isomerase-like protein (cupin superfamily)
MVSTADRIEDIGPQPQSFDIERATKENTNYRSVAWSGRYLQVTLMSIPAGGDIGLEAHPETDQFLRLDAGSGRVQMGPAKDKLTFEKEVSNGWCVLVPAGTWHNITNIGATTMQVYAIYAPPIIHPTRCRRRRRRLMPTKTTTQRPGQCSQNMPPINTGDRKELSENFCNPLRRAIGCWSSSCDAKTAHPPSMCINTLLMRVGTPRDVGEDLRQPFHFRRKTQAAIRHNRGMIRFYTCC